MKFSKKSLTKPKSTNLNSHYTYKDQEEKMANKRKNEAQKDINLFNFLSSKKYEERWVVKKTENKHIQNILDKCSKRDTGNRGEPDLIYVNEKKRLLILIEDKDTISQHKSTNEDKPLDYAIDGIKHYLSHFQNKNLENFEDTIKKYFKHWLIVGLAVSGDINDEYNHLISTFIIQGDEIKNMDTEEVLDENDYISFFENLDIEKIAKNISESSGKINNVLRSLDSQKRPVLLSALMICLFSKEKRVNEFKESYSGWGIKNIIRNIPSTIEDVLTNEGISQEKIKILINELSFMKTDNDINNTDILKEILEELENNVIPLFDKKTNYDIIGKFYEEFLRYAGITNVKKGIVLTPNHITKLFTELIDIKTNDVILDPCCGTGAFLIAGMNKLFDKINNSGIRNKNEIIKQIKQNQLIGFEKSTTMYSLSISNMLFRGDGKSKIFNLDYFSEESDEILKKLKNKGISPTIGLMNPPYGGRANKDNPTKKEIQFLEKMLDTVSRYGIMIAPLSTYIREEATRERILSKHTLKCVINMPKELFQPNAATNTAIAVFETNNPHNNKEVIFYDLADDGFVMSKNKGRTDALNKWVNVKRKLFEELNDVEKFGDGLHLLKKSISGKDEWIIQAHSETDYGDLTEKSFVRSIKEYVIFSTKLKLNLLDKGIDELSLLEILNENNISAENILSEDAV